MRHPEGSEEEYQAYSRYVGECDEENLDALSIMLWRIHGCPSEPLYSVNQYPAWVVEE